MKDGQSADFRALYDQYGRQFRQPTPGLESYVTIYVGGYGGYHGGHTTAMGAPPHPTEPRIIERIVKVPVYIERPAPTPPARVYPPSQGIARPYHCTKPAGKHPGYVRVAA